MANVFGGKGIFGICNAALGQNYSPSTKRVLTHIEFARKVDTDVQIASVDGETAISKI
jgi:hypothetical protein